MFLIIIAGSYAQAREGGGGNKTYVPVTRFDPARDAAKDIRVAVAEARRSGRRVLLDVGGDWCIWCRRLDTLFATHREISDYRDAHYVVVTVNWSKENKNERVLSRYPPVSGYPHLFVLEDDGSLIHSQDTGQLEKGKGHDPDKVMVFLKRWAPKE
jgi:thiol:disulfide interchange protein